MALPVFRIRSINRDSETDKARFNRLEQLIRKLASEIENEHNGLKRRLSDTSTSAAFAQETFENEGDPAISSKVDDLTSSMRRYSERIDTLNKQMEFIRNLEKSIADFPAKNY